MKCLDDCHNYELDNFIKGDRPEELAFYRMALDGAKSPGTTNEEVIEVLIHRIEYLNEKWLDGKFSCDENSRAVSHLKMALYQLNLRTADRMARKVEGTHSV